jgi:tellurite resistance protein
MSLFDTVLGTETQTLVTLSPAEAFAAITLATIAIDGYLTEDEASCISSVLSRMKLFRNYSNELMNKLFDKILGILCRDGMNSLFNAAKESLSQDLREAAFAVAADLVLADGMMTEEEKYFLNDLYQALSVSNEIAVQTVQVILIKNRA